MMTVLLMPPQLLLLLHPCRMVVYDDFEVQFNGSAKSKRGLSLPPYRYNVTAKPRCVRQRLAT
jgi:hypothetical protein